MKRSVLALLVVAAAVLGGEAIAEAQQVGRRPPPVRPLPPRPRPGTPSANVPELDPNAAGAAVALLLGSVAVISAGRRREEA